MITVKSREWWIGPQWYAGQPHWILVSLVFFSGSPDAETDGQIVLQSILR
jgi:hypothetical protein